LTATGWTMRDKLIALALSEDGYMEKDAGMELYNKLPGGHGNYTKYAKELDGVEGFYNGKKQGYPWCDVFVDWCFYKCFGEAARQMLCQPSYSAGAGCTYSAAYYKAAGRFHNTPQPGDQIFFGDDTECVHTGLVYKVDEGFVYTVEGNTSAAGGVVANGGQVCRKRYALSYAAIYGYGRPRWDAEPEASPAAKTVTLTVRELHRGMSGAQVKSMQRLLIPRGFDCGRWGADGDFGGDTERSLKAFQQENRLEPDGICGENSWRALVGED